MNFPVTVLQALSAFVIFVAGYLMFFASIICALILATCIYKGGRIIKAYTVRTCQTLEAEGPVKARVRR